MTGGRRRAQRVLLLFALVVGVLGMHALVLIPAQPATGAAVAASDVPFVAVGPGPGHAGPDGVMGPAGVVAATVGHGSAQPGHGASHGPSHGQGDGSMPSSLHQVLHLCLAILSALLALGAIALALWRNVRPDRHAIRINGPDGRAPRRRPPPTSVRLAQLGVLRN